jgi:hypothetical protein
MVMAFSGLRVTPLKVVVASILVMNLVDAAFTIGWTSAGLATEANPLLDDVLARSPVLFMIAKLALVSLGIFLLFRLRRRRLALAGLVACSCVYASLLVYHVTRLSALLG